MSRLQVLVATMNATNTKELYTRMNLKSDALVINQSDRVDYENLNIGGSIIECYTFAERGLSKSRNNALMRATADIVCLADDDMVYSDSYVNDILSEFEKHPEADAIVFNVDLINGDRKTHKIDCYGRVGKRESKEYCSVNIAMRREKVLLKNIFFNIQFGSGSTYKCGEDTLFLKDLIDSGLRLYRSPVKIADVDMSESTWFKGYDEEFFRNKGAVMAAAYPKLCYLLVIIQALKNSKRRLGSYSEFWKLLKWYSNGMHDFKEKFR